MVLMMGNHKNHIHNVGKMYNKALEDKILLLGTYRKEVLGLVWELV
jgi:hypothetical protein